jgi:hypothetical protein
MKLKLFKQEAKPKGRRGLLAGSIEAHNAAVKAAANRKLNKLLKSSTTPASIPTTSKVVTESIKTNKVTFKKLDESNYHKITIQSPVDIYVHKTLTSMYITPHKTELVKNT